jgi:hypothetical protein
MLAVCSGLFHILAYLDYNSQVARGRTKPNGTTWLIWSILAVASSASYLKATGDVWKSVIPLVNVVLCVATLALAVYMKEFKRPDRTDFVALIIGVIAVLVWKKYGSAKYANLIVQVAILMGFIPTWRSIIKDPACERSRPWCIWTAGYVLSIAVVILRWNGQGCDLAYPINMVILHPSIPILAMMRRRKFSKK